MSEEEDHKSVRWLIVFSVLAVLGFVVTFALRVGEQPDDGVQARQPDPAIAGAVENELSELAGVKTVAVTNTLDCLEDCTKTRQNYLATIDLRHDVTAEQISAIVAGHDEVAPQKVGIAAVPVVLRLGPAQTLRVASVHYGFGVTQAQAYLTAVQASADVQVRYGPPALGESPLLTVAASIPDLVCHNADAAMSQTIPAVSSAASVGGIEFSTVRLDCGTAALKVGIAAGASYQPGWTQAATSIDDICRENGCGKTGGAIEDVSVTFTNGSTDLVVELHDGQQLPSHDLAALKAVVDELSAAGAVNPQLDLRNY